MKHSSFPYHTPRQAAKNLFVQLTTVMRSKRFFPVRMTTVFIILSFLFLSCDIPEETYDNPLDLETNQEQGINPPALVFAPNAVTTTVGSSVSIEVYALEVSNVAGSHIEVSYDKNKLSLTSVSLGTFFASGEDPIFFYENDGGTVDIYTSYLGTETSVSGTGTLAYLVFSVTAPGQSILSYSTSCELVD
ncbi:MAG: cohesin domain-containing protein, partial [Fidelibacterota bacterium]